MKFLEDKVAQVLNDLEIPYKSVVSDRTGATVELHQGISTLDLTQKVRQDPRYGPRLELHPFGYFLEFLNFNVPSLRALADIYMDFRTEGGRVIRIRGVMKRGRVFTVGGDVVTCLSLGELESVWSLDQRENAVGEEVDALG